MRNLTVGLAALGLGLGAAALAAQRPARDARPARSWSEETRETAERSRYPALDCKTALLPILAAYDSARRSRTPVGPPNALVQARERAARESEASEARDALDNQQRRLMMQQGPDGTTMSRNQIAALWPRYVSSWSASPPHGRLGYRTSNGRRYAVAGRQLATQLAAVEATLICLDVTR